MAKFLAGERNIEHPDVSFLKNPMALMTVHHAYLGGLTVEDNFTPIQEWRLIRTLERQALRDDPRAIDPLHELVKLDRYERAALARRAGSLRALLGGLPVKLST